MNSKVKLKTLGFLFTFFFLQIINGQTNWIEEKLNFDDLTMKTIVVKQISGAISLIGTSSKDVIIKHNIIPKDKSLLNYDKPKLKYRIENGRLEIYNYQEEWIINLEISIPNKTNVAINAVDDGDINLKNIDGELSINHVNGSISCINVKGFVSATTTNGNINVKIENLSGNKPIVLSTFAGDIVVEFMSKAKLAFTLSTESGKLINEFEKISSNINLNLDKININPKLLRNKKLSTGTINRGGTEIYCFNYSGTITLKPNHYEN